MMVHSSSVLRSDRTRLQAALVAAGLDRHTVPVAAEGDRWEITIGGRRGSASLANHWFVLDFPPRPGRARRPIRLLAQNAQLPGNVKHVLDRGSVRLRAEIPIDEPAVQGPDELGALVMQSVVGLSIALGADSSGGPSKTAVKAAVAAEPASLPELCAEAGWSFSERSEGGISVDLEVADRAFYQASVQRHFAGIHLTVDPNRGDPPSAEFSRLGVAVLLLSVSGAVRMVSAISRPSNGKPENGHDTLFRIELPATASGATLSHALSALSVACDLCGREVRALAQDPEFARAFLEVCHPRSLPRSKSRRRADGAASEDRGRKLLRRSDRFVQTTTKEESKWSRSKTPQPAG